MAKLPNRATLLLVGGFVLLVGLYDISYLLAGRMADDVQQYLLKQALSSEFRAIEHLSEATLPSRQELSTRGYIYWLIADENGVVVQSSTSSARELIRRTDVPSDRVIRRKVYVMGSPVAVYDIAVPIGQKYVLQAGIPAARISHRVEVLSERTSRTVLFAIMAGIFLIAVSLIYSIILLKRVRHLRSEIEMHRQRAYVGQLASGLAHELKNPLNTVKMNIQLISESNEIASSEKLSRRMERIQQELSRLVGTLDTFLRFAKPSIAKKERLDIRTLLHQVVRFISPECATEGILVKEELPDGALYIHADEKLIKQLLLNILLNAKEASPKGSEISVRLWRSARDISISIEDKGLGIPNDKLQHIFEPFYTTKAHGSGIGMAVVKRVVEEHGGSIRVASEEGKGTTITVRLPV